MAEEQNIEQEQEKQQPSEEQQQAEPAKKTLNKADLFGKIKLPVLVVLVAVLAVGSGLAVAKVAKGNGGKQKTTTTAAEEKKKELGKFVTLDPFTVNLAGGTNYLQTAIAFEIKSENAELAKEIEERKPQINDSVITILSAKSLEQIDTAEKREKLKDEIKKAVDSMLSYGKIERVYFSTFIMQ
jgi:flagellar FliL protein